MDEQQTPEAIPESKLNYIAMGIAGIVVIGGFFFFSGMNKKAEQELAYTTPAPTDTIGQFQEGPPGEPASPSANPKMQDKLIVEDKTVGTGVEAVAGKSVTVNYTGTLVDGKKFDSSYDRGTPFTFSLGSGQVIAGWDQGVSGMKVGGKRKLTIPPSLGYGAAGAAGVIPPNAILIFEIELLKVE